MSKYEIDKYGTKIWVNDKGQLHRVDGPAYEDIYGNKEWWVNGDLHREDGPAMEWADGGKQWYYYDKHIKCFSQEEFLQLIKLKAFW